MNDDFKKRAREICGQLTVEEKITLICSHQIAVDRLGLREFNFGSESARGYVGREPANYSTVFPQPIGMAGTFDTELMERLGEIAGNEARAYFNHDPLISPMMWGPTVDMERDPRWGRTEEGYGEDVCLAGEMTRAYTEGMAGDDGKYLKTIPTLKHFCGNNYEAERFGTNSSMPLRLKYEYYYAAFANAIKGGGAKSVMTAYNEINGIPAICNPEVKTILKDQWGLWFTVSDAGDLSQNTLCHRYSSDHGDAVAESLKAGCDIMTDNDELVYSAAKSALERGLITEDDLDRSICNTLYAQLKLGMYAEDCAYNHISLDVLDDPDSREMCLRAAREQVVLLKNNGILPLKKAPEKIAVVGASAMDNFRDWYTGYFRDAVTPAEGMRREFPESEIVTDTLWDIVAIQADNGKYLRVHEDGTVAADGDAPDDDALFELRNWSDGWECLFSAKYGKYIRMNCGGLTLHEEDIYSWFTRETFNICRLGGNEVAVRDYLEHHYLANTADGLKFCEMSSRKPHTRFTMTCVSRGIDRLKELEEECGLVMICVGNHPIQAAKECFDRKTLALTVQPDIVEESLKYGEKTVLAVISSFPYAINSADERLAAVLYSTHAGAHLGTALAETVSGKNNPAGRLAMTWYRTEHDLPRITDYDIVKNKVTYMYFDGTPLYPFGYGLSYAEFAYKKLDAEPCPDGSIKAAVTLENISDIDGDEVVQLYFTTSAYEYAPLKKLCAFARVHVKAHETVTAELTVKPDILEIYDVTLGRMIRHGGEYRFMVGGSSDNTPLECTVELEGDTLAQRGDSFDAHTADSLWGVEIMWSKKLKRHYIRANGWDGFVSYHRLPLNGKRYVTVTASSVMHKTDIDIYTGERIYKINADVSVNDDDLREYTVEIEPTDVTELGIHPCEGVNIFSVSVK